MLSPQQKTGYAAEQQACQFLEKQGLTFVKQNFSCPAGEIDLIMQDQHHLVFVEVRFRTQTDFGAGIETISYSKQRRLIKSASLYLQQHDLTDKTACRFDVLGMAKNQNIVWIKDAFQVQY